MKKLIYLLMALTLIIGLLTPATASASSNEEDERLKQVSENGDFTVTKEDNGYSLTDKKTGEVTKVSFDNSGTSGTIKNPDGSLNELSIEKSDLDNGEKVVLNIDGEWAGQVETETVQPDSESNKFTTAASSGYKFVKTYRVQVDATKKAAGIAAVIIGLIPIFAVPMAIVGAIEVLRPQKKAYVECAFYYNQYAALNKQFKKIFRVYKKSNYTQMTKTYTIYERPFN